MSKLPILEAFVTSTAKLLPNLFKLVVKALPTPTID